jgi:putative oxidoreductase
MQLNTLFQTGNGNNLATLLLRVGIGIILAAHGSQKLFGWFDGYGLEATGQWMASIGLSPGYLMALLAGSAEFLGGIALIIGFLTRPAAIISAFTMLIALFVVHLGNGFFLSNNGFEYAFALSIACIAIAAQGAGKWSIDHHITKLMH